MIKISVQYTYGLEARKVWYKLLSSSINWYKLVSAGPLQALKGGGGGGGGFGPREGGRVIWYRMIDETEDMMTGRSAGIVRCCAPSSSDYSSFVTLCMSCKRRERKQNMAQKVQRYRYHPV